MKFLVFIMIVMSCASHKHKVKSQLVSFIHTAAEGRLSSASAAKYTTGQLLKDFQNLSAIDFKKLNSQNLLEKVSVSIAENECSPKRCQVRYNVNYSVKKGIDSETSSIKEAILLLENSHWKISQISNLSTKVEYLSPLEILIKR